MADNTTHDETAELSLLKRAYLALEAAEARCRALELARAEPIALVGLGCRLPGAATPADYWDLLRTGGDAVSDVPADRWDTDALYDPDPTVTGTMCTRRGGYLRQPVDQFDPQFFGISPREAETMDPQQRLLLEVAWEALEDAVQIEDRLAGSATGVFIGITSHDYADLMLGGQTLDQVGTHMITGNTHNAAAGRLSYCFGFHGPCLAVDTACSSSLVAIHLACRSLLQGECRRALAGGVNLILSPVATVALSQGGVLAPDGVCRAFDAAASGMVRGEGCGVVVLKRLSDALADGDAIRAVIRGSGMNQDGPSSGLTVPNGPAQVALIRATLAGAGLSPNDIDYIEAHGTGTPLGDPIELRALAEVFGADRDRPLVIGSVKPNIGHLEACAGVAGLVKVVLALQHDTMPQHLHFREPTPHVPWEGLPFLVPTAPRAWPPRSRPRLAGVSSFGFSGVNAHVLVQEAPDAAPRRVTEHGQRSLTERDQRSLHVLPLSGRSAPALRQTAERLAAHLARHDDLDWEDVCFSAGVGRAHGAHRLAVPARSTEEARGHLGAFLGGRAEPGLAQGHAATPPRVAFLFTGQGSQYAGMGRGLYTSEPVFRDLMDRCDTILRGEIDRHLIDVLFSDNTSGSAIDDTAYAQPALFAIEYALAELWRSWGVQPALVLGHSVGEVVAACVAGVFSLEDGLRLTAARGRLMQALPRDGAMLAVGAGALVVDALVRPRAGDVSIAAYNAPDETVLSGRRDAVAAIAAELATKGIRARPLRVSHAFHSPLMDPMLDAFEAKAEQYRMSAPRIGLISNLVGGPAPAEIATASYWRRHVRLPVRFADGIAQARQQGCSVFLEIGPRPTLLTLGQQSVPEAGIAWLPSLHLAVPDGQSMRQSLAELYALGARIDWHGVDRDRPRRRVALPTTPFQRQRCWVDLATPRPERSVHRASVQRGHPLLGTGIDLAANRERRFEAQIAGTAPAFLQDHRLFGETILPAAAFIDLALAAAQAAFDAEGVSIENVAFERALLLPAAGSRTLQTVVQPDDAHGCDFAIYSRDPTATGDAWTRHATGRLRQSATLPAPPQEDIAVLIAGAGVEQDVATLYGKCRARGVDLGPRFQALHRVWSREATALGALRLTAGTGADSSGENVFPLHPVLLDAAFQTMNAVFADHGSGDVYMPVSLDRIVLHRRLGTAGWSRVRVEPILGVTKHSLRVDATVLYEDGTVAAVLEGLHLALARREQVVAASPAIADWLYAVEWREQPTQAQATPERVDRPSAEEIGEHILPGLHAAFRDPPEFARFGVFLDEIEDAAIDYILLALQALGWVPEPGRRMTTPALAAQLGIADRHRRLFARLLAILAEAAILHEAGPDLWDVGIWEAGAPASRRGQPDRIGALLRRYPEAAAELTLLQRCGNRLAEVLRGDCDPLGLLFPQGGAVSATSLYGRSPGARAANDFLARLVAAVIARTPGDRPLRVLEIGAGTGVSTAQLLPVLGSRCTEYIFTDVSPLFVHQAAERFHDQSFVRCRVLDIETSPVTQGFAAESCDIVIAANVLHATRDIGAALWHARELLAPGGLLVLLEGTARLRFIDLIFGMIEGWWRFTDTALRPDHPLLPPDLWQSQLGACGFRHAGTVAASRAASSVWSTQALLAAVRDEGAPAEAGRPPDRCLQDRWIIFAHEPSRLSDALRERIETTGGIVTLVVPGSRYQFVGDSVRLDPTDRTQFVRLFEDTGGKLAGIVNLWPITIGGDSPATAEAFGWGAALHLVQAIVGMAADTPPALWLVTRGAQPAGARSVKLSGVFQSPLLGLGKIVALEHPELRCVCVDLDTDDDATAASELFDEIRRPAGEDQVALRAGRRHVARMVRQPPVGQSSAGGHTGGRVRPDTTYLVTGGLRGLGLATASWLVESGARSLVLLGRSAPDAAAIAGLADMRNAGAAVEAVQGDVADAGWMAALLAHIDADLPPLRGVIHAAGVLDDGILEHQTVERFRPVLAPKLLGAWHLHRLTQDRTLDFFVLYSSLASLLGSAGQANHAAANAFLDALAHHRSGMGLPGLSINWGVWSEIGAAVRHQVGERVAAQGMGTIAPRQGMRILEHLLFRPLTQVGVMPLDWTLFAAQHSTRRRPALFAELIDAIPAAAGQPTPPPQELATALHAAPQAERQMLLAANLRTQVARVLRLAPDAVDPHQPLARMGLDSLMAVELRNRLRTQLGIDVQLVRFLEDASIAALAAEIGLRFETQDPAPGAATDDELLLRRIDQMTDAEVDALLDAALAGEGP